MLKAPVYAPYVNARIPPTHAFSHPRLGLVHAFESTVTKVTLSGNGRA